MKKRFFGVCCVCRESLHRHNSSEYSRRRELCLECRRKISGPEINNLCFSCLRTLTEDNSCGESREASLCFKCFIQEILLYLRGVNTLYDKYFQRLCSDSDVELGDEEDDDPTFS